MGGPVQMTENLKFIGKYALDEFTRKFDAKHLAIFVKPANSLLALPIDIAKFVVLERDVEPIQIGTVELFFQRLSVKYAPRFRAHN